MTIYIGIDLGTTYTGAIYSSGPGHYESIYYDEGSKFPSELFYDPNSKEWKIGHDAFNTMLQTDTEYGLLKEFKRDMGTDRRYEVPSIGYITPVEASAIILKYVVGMVLAKGIRLDDVYWAISVPALFSERAKDATRQAAIMAGIPGDRLSLVLEPEAATIAIAEQQRHIKIAPGDYILTFDFGGGTLDIVLLRQAKNGILEPVVNNGGDLYLGGNDIDKALLEFCYREILKKEQAKKWPPIEKWPQLTTTFYLRESMARILKKNLGQKKAALNVGLNPSLAYEGRPLNVKVSVEEFYTILQPFVQRARNAVHEVLNRASKKPSEIDHIVMVGGTSHIVHFREMLESIFNNKRIVYPANLSEAVMRGTVIYARNPEIIRGKIAGRTYGVWTHRAKRLGDPSDRLTKDSQYYRFNRIFFKAGEVVNPEGKTHIFTPMFGEQEAVTFKLLWGDNDDPANCEVAALITLPIPKPPEDYQLELTLKIEEDNLMHAYAVDPQTGKTEPGIIAWEPIEYHKYKP